MLHGSRPVMAEEEGRGSVRGEEDRPLAGSSRGGGGEVVEMALLLTSTEATALESAAQAHDMSVARLLRSLIRESLARGIMPAAPHRSCPGAES